MTLLATLLAVTGALASPDAPVFVLLERDDAIVLERYEVAAGETLLLERSVETGVVDVVLPPATGGSGSIAAAGQGETIAVHFDGNGLQATHRAPDGEAWQGPRVALADLHSWSIRVCLTAGDGRGWAFVLSDYERARRDEIGPVIDMFAGKVPMGPDDYSVYTDTMRVRAGEPVHGEAPLLHQGHLFIEGQVVGGETGTFVLDTGGAMTAIDSSLLPEGTPVTETQMVQYSRAGRELLKYAPGGAGGAIGGIDGQATLAELRFGDLTFTDVSVAVFDTFPQIFDRPVVGILGLDQLRRARCVSVTVDGESGTLRLAPAPGDADGGHIDELLYTFVNGHLMVGAAVNDTPVSLILDTGSPGLLLDRVAAETAGVEIDDEQARDAQGLDEGALRLAPAMARSVRLGETLIEGSRLHVGPLPVFDSMRGRDQCVGLLGNALLERFERCEIDFERERVRLVSDRGASDR